MPRTLPAALRKNPPRPKRNPTHQRNPVFPSAASLPAPIPATEDILGAALKYDLSTLGNLRAHGLGFLTCWVQELTHKKALEKCGFEWQRLSLMFHVCPEFRQLYQEVGKTVRELQAAALEDAAFTRSIEGDKVRPGYLPASDTLHKTMLSGLIPERYGKDTDQNVQAVQVTINI